MSDGVKNTDILQSGQHEANTFYRHWRLNEQYKYKQRYEKRDDAIAQYTEPGGYSSEKAIRSQCV
jgi:hypothetical protein